MDSVLGEQPKTLDQVLAKLEAYKSEVKFRSVNQFDIKAFCHPKQFEFVADHSPYATAVTSRRSGKTWGCAADLLNTSRQFPGIPNLYITLTRANAKILLWPVLKNLNEKYRLGGEPNEADLCLTLPNSSPIYLAGVNDQSQIHKFRGLKLKKVYLDEAQSMRAYIRELIDDVLAPALVDCDGMLRVTGTPAPVPVGYFHDISKSAQWSHHFFTIFDNPFIPNARARLELELKRRGVTIEHPSIQREWFGKWALDLDALFLHYDESRNDFESLPDGHEWEHVTCIDLGFEDSDAIGVITFSPTYPDAFLEYELITPKQTITPLAGQIHSTLTRYPSLAVVMDMGGLGKKIGEEIRKRHGIPVEAADKTRKVEHLALLDDALMTGRFKAHKGSVFAQDCMLLEKERDPERPDLLTIRGHSDIVDAVLYGFRKAQHWLHEPKIEKPKRGSLEELQEQEDEHRRFAEDQIQGSKEEERFWSDPFDD